VFREVVAQFIGRLCLINQATTIMRARAFRDVVAQFIGRLCLINQATTRILG